MITTQLVVGIVFLFILVTMFIFLEIYKESMEQNAIISSEQAVVQVSNTIGSYTEDMKEIMKQIRDSFAQNEEKRDEALRALVNIRSDIVLTSFYDENGTMIESYSHNYQVKENPIKDLSFMDVNQSDLPKITDQLIISTPHVESLLQNYYPWVVSIMQKMKDYYGNEYEVVMDIRFSQIANYVDDVGIGQHGYCFIIDLDGNIIYHPQQQLIFAGLKEEQTALLSKMKDGTQTNNSVIYSINTLENTNWRIVGVSFVDEMITAQFEKTFIVLLVLFAIVILTAMLTSFALSHMISRPIQKLIGSMSDFEKNAENYSFRTIQGTGEIEALSDSFDHMVVRIQELMEKVRNEEISLRKTELKALQAQINPHFLYNTLDAIEWLCEEGRNQDAGEMVNALATLFRISISKGHELIPIEKELEHAKSYLKIQNFRYKNQFVYTFDIEEVCLSYYCNKITLQPIIENAIYHGINRMIDEGHIHISIKEMGENIIFSVEDNGIGMTKEQSRSILSNEPGDYAGIGIKNVNDRIKIFFGEEYGITIQSEPDEGTEVIICMPKIREDSDDTK